MISVIVPIYNSERYLKDCLLSIYNQTYTDFEIITVNDGSTDQSAAIVEQMLQDYGKIIPVTMPKNSGLSAARNAGIERASGEYICYVDSDDTLEPDYLEELYHTAINNNADLVIGNFREVDEELKPLSADYVNGQKLSKLNKGRQSDCYQDGLISNTLLIHSISVSYLDHYAVATVVAWNKLMKAGIAKANRFKEGYLHEDEFWIMPLLLSCDRIAWTSHVVYNYRIRNGSITRNDSSRTGSEENRKKAWEHVQVLDAFENRISAVADIKAIDHDERYKLKVKVTYHYFGNIINQYLQCYCDYGLDQKSCHSYFSKRMKDAIKKYHAYIDSKNLFKYFIFSVNEAFFFRVFWKKKIISK